MISALRKFFGLPIFVDAGSATVVAVITLMWWGVQAGVFYVVDSTQTTWEGVCAVEAVSYSFWSGSSATLDCDGYGQYETSNDNRVLVAFLGRPGEPLQCSIAGNGNIHCEE